MKFLVAALVLGICVGNVSGSTWTCGEGGSIKYTGSTTVFPVTQNVANRYDNSCTATIFTGTSTGSSAGAKGVCNDGGQTDIGNMSREFKSTEATPIAGSDNQYQCVKTTNVAIRVPVAIDGLSLIVERDGLAWKNCLGIRTVPGLTAGEIRWIFSSLQTLENDKSIIRNNDGNPTTKLWSEIDVKCPAVPIVAVGPSSIYGTHDFFKEIMFVGGATETFQTGFQTFADNSAALRDKVLNTDYSIGFLGYSFYDFNDASLQGVPVDGIMPSKAALIDNSYILFARRIYSMYWKDTNALKKTKCFNDFHFSAVGKTLIDGTFFVPIPEVEWTSMKDRVPGTCQQPGTTRAPTRSPTPKPVCRCFFLFRLLGTCCK